MGILDQVPLCRGVIENHLVENHYYNEMGQIALNLLKPSDPQEQRNFYHITLFFSSKISQVFESMNEKNNQQRLEWEEYSEITIFILGNNNR